MKWINIPSIFSGLFIIIIFTGYAGAQKPSSDAHYYFRQGIAYYETGQYDNAISDFNKALEINPNYAEAYYNRGIINLRKQEYDKALDDLEKAQSLGFKVDPKFLNNARGYDRESK